MHLYKLKNAINFEQVLAKSIEQHCIMYIIMYRIVFILKIIVDEEYYITR